jgi:hypothetical protein
MVTCIQELDVTWAQMEFGHEMHQRTSLKLISASEELIETLEDNQVEFEQWYILCLHAPRKNKLLTQTLKILIFVSLVAPLPLTLPLFPPRLSVFLSQSSKIISVCANLIHTIRFNSKI